LLFEEFDASFFKAGEDLDEDFVLLLVFLFIRMLFCEVFDFFFMA